MLSAIVLTKNEEANIPDCLSALAWADEVLVVDSGSADMTRALAEKYGARVVEHAFADFASQRNFAMSEAKGDWVLFIDADERVTSELSDEIRRVLTDSEVPRVYAIPRRTFFFGKPLRFSDARGDAPIRLFPRAGVRWDQPVHEMISTTLPRVKLNHFILHYSTRDLAHYKQKVMEYVPLELETMRQKGVRPGFLKVLFRPPVTFLYLYFWKRGILDGIAGFQYAILSAYYTLVKHWRYWRTR
jgi:glycosyltransferase involved in cell wall biosynthesis